MRMIPFKITNDTPLITITLVICMELFKNGKLNTNKKLSFF